MAAVISSFLSRAPTGSWADMCSARRPRAKAALTPANYCADCMGCDAISGCPGNEKVKNVLNWKPRYSLIEVLDRSAGSSRFDLTKVEPAPPAVLTGNAEVAA